MKIQLNTVYHCKTREDANAFMQDCDEQGIRWCSGKRTSADNSAWNHYESLTCYLVTDDKQISFGDLPYFVLKHPRLEIITYSSSLPETEEEIAAIDLAWRQLMQIEERPK